MSHSKKRPASIEEALEFWCESFPERRDNRPVECEKPGEFRNHFSDGLANSHDSQAEPSRRATTAG
jgi:hypothetical protein